MENSPLSIKKYFVSLAQQEGMLWVKGNEFKAGSDIEKYLNVFRKVLGRTDPKYLNLEVGYDWCCAFVYYLMTQAGYKVSITPIHNSTNTLAAVRTWYNWSMQEKIFLENPNNPEPGDLILFDKLIEGVELDHIGIVLKNYDDMIITAEGNYHNSSGIFKRKKDSKIRGYIRL